MTGRWRQRILLLIPRRFWHLRVWRWYRIVREWLYRIGLLKAETGRHRGTVNDGDVVFIIGRSDDGIDGGDR